MRRRPLFGALTGVGGVCAVLLGLAAIDPRVRAQVGQMAQGRAPSGEVVEAGWRMQELAGILVQAIQDQSIEHAPLVVFTLAATILVVFMLRT